MPGMSERQAVSPSSLQSKTICAPMQMPSRGLPEAAQSLRKLSNPAFFSSPIA